MCRAPRLPRLYYRLVGTTDVSGRLWWKIEITEADGVVKVASEEDLGAVANGDGLGFDNTTVGDEVVGEDGPCVGSS